MQASVILSTYNSPAWLAKVLWGYACQSCKDFEIVLADDGSGPQTADLVRQLRSELGLALTHVWQEDRGFRKCRILNKAILQARAPYLLFSDGDCIPRRDFVETHLRRAEKGHFLSGSYYKLPMATSVAIGTSDIVSGRCFDPAWLRRQGLPFWRNTWKVACSERLAPLLNRLTPAKCNLKGSNASAWLEDVLRVNGFDERMPWGGEDREFGVRLLNAGVKARHVRYDAACLHLDHARSYADPARVAANKALRQYNERQRISSTDYGIRQLDPAAIRVL